MNGKREKILRAALALFGRFGYKKTSVDDIANQSDMAKGTVYLYFKNKEDIFIKVIEDIGQSYQEMVTQKFAAAKNPVEKLNSYMHAVISFHVNRIQIVEISYERHVEIEKLTNERTPIGDALRKILGENQALVESILQEGVDSGDFDVEDISSTATILRRSLESIIHPHFPEFCTISKEDLCQALADTMINGLRKR